MLINPHCRRFPGLSAVSAYEIVSGNKANRQGNSNGKNPAKKTGEDAINSYPGNAGKSEKNTIRFTPSSRLIIRQVVNNQINH